MVWKSRFPGVCTVRVLLLLCLAPVGTGCLEATIHAEKPVTVQVGIAPQFAIQDFDGDSRPDVATVEEWRGTPGNHYQIRFRLSTGASQDIDLIAPAGGLDISSRDVNGDDFADVVVTTAGTKRPVVVLLNDGRGNFTASDPAAFPGAFPDSDDSWRGLAEGLRDASPALYSRFFSGDLEGSCKTFSTATETRVFTSRLERLEIDEPGRSYFGRAPPIFEDPR
jgi:hypothetical protein